MIKKLLFILFISVSSLTFSQEKSVADLSASPNPFSNNTTVTFNANNDQDIVLTVRNVLGKTVFSKVYRAKKGNNSIQFFRNDLKSGMYIYAIQTRKDVISKRFIIK